MRYLFITILFILSVNINAQSRKQPVLVTDMLKIKTISAVTLTEDGSLAAFVVTSIEPESDTAKL